MTIVLIWDLNIAGIIKYIVKIKNNVCIFATYTIKLLIIRGKVVSHDMFFFKYKVTHRSM